MKKLITLTACALALLSAKAQTTINYSAYSTWAPSTDTFRDLTPSGIMPMANGTWDLSTANYMSGYFSTDKVPYTNAALPTATFSQLSTYTFSALSYFSNICYGINSQGFQRIGERMDRQAFSLGNVTMNNTDSLVFLNQVIPYSSPRTILAFPATYGTNWGSDYKYNTNFNLTIASYGMNNVPGFRRSHFIETDSVKAWGKMRVKTMSNQTTSYMDVLGVKTRIEVIDSFYLNGSPAPAALLTALGLSQGMSNKYYRIGYYRAGEAESLLYMSYSDATFTTPTGASIHARRLPVPTAVHNVNSISASLYPNPAASGSPLNITLEETSAGNWSYELTNATGQVVNAAPLQLNGNKAQIDLQSTTPGMYYLSIGKDGQKVAVKPVMIKN